MSPTNDPATGADREWTTRIARRVHVVRSVYERGRDETIRAEPRDAALVEAVRSVASMSQSITGYLDPEVARAAAFELLEAVGELLIVHDPEGLFVLVHALAAVYPDVTETLSERVEENARMHPENEWAVAIRQTWSPIEWRLSDASIASGEWLP